MNEASDLVANIILNDINTLIEDLNNVIKAHNVLVDENQKLKSRIDKAINYMDNTFNISNMKEFFEILNKVEEILEGSDVK